MIDRTISHYRIHAKLGEGGMGAIYRAQDLILGREVALKLLPVEMTADLHARKRLLKEAQAASRLNHPNIATIYEVNESDDTPFISMELVTGQTLKELLQQGHVERSRLMDISRQIAEGLQEAHRLGVFHRDIKPANIMLDSRSRVKILDFGLASLAEHDRPPAPTDETVVTWSGPQSTTGGTVPYMSPEQLRGEPADARSDIFSFGVLLYECFGGHLPFRGETSVDILHAILHEAQVPLRNLVPDIPADLDHLVERCLVKSPAGRCGSMTEVLGALRGADATPARPEKSLAVLYFTNLSGDKEDEYFRDGMTEDIITDLSKIKELQIFPRSAVVVFRGKEMPASQIGRQLGAAYILDGSIRRAGARLRITAQLAETRSGHSVWAERYDRQLEDVFEIQDEIAKSIAGALRIVLTENEKREIAKVPTREVQAYDYYLRGRQFFYQLTRKGNDFARQMFARAIAIDPGYARAYAGVADCCSIECLWFAAGPNVLREAVSASRRAVDLDPDSAEAHAARALAESLTKNYPEAEREFETAIRLNPQLYDVYFFYGRMCFTQALFEKAVGLFSKAVQINPDAYNATSGRSLCLQALGRMEDARLAARECFEATQRQLELHPDDVRALYLGANSLCGLEDYPRALELANQALALEPDEPTVIYNVACVYASVGQPEKAIDALEKILGHGFGQKEWIEKDPDFAAIREHPRFQALMRRLSSGGEERAAGS